jgi:hypothetical protein
MIVDAEWPSSLIQAHPAGLVTPRVSSFSVASTPARTASPTPSLSSSVTSASDASSEGSLANPFSSTLSFHSVPMEVEEYTLLDLYHHFWPSKSHDMASEKDWVASTGIQSLRNSESKPRTAAYITIYGGSESIARTKWMSERTVLVKGRGLELLPDDCGSLLLI